MKKIFTLLILSILFMGHAQSGIGNDSQKRNILPLPTTANAYALDKVGKLPIDLFKGKANISVPLYTINTDGLSIPISLSYNTGGIKLNEVSSTVGLGWSLNVPNSITQNIIDLDDKYFQPYSKDINMINNYVKNAGISDNDIKAVVDGIYLGNYDTKPDIFSYSLPTSSGNFIMSNSTGHTIPHNDLKIEGSNELKNFTIIDTKGNIFYLSPKSISIYNNGESGQVVINESLYALDSIKTVSNKKIYFKYNKSFAYTEKSINERANLLITEKPSGSYEPIFPLPPYERYVGESGNTEWVLTNIIYPDGEINFQYSDDNNLNTIQGELYRKDLNSQKGIALRKVLVKNKAGNIIKDLILNYSYFESNSVIKTFQDYRLKLTEVYDNLQDSKYSFSYIDNIPLPARNSNNDDYWGYINNLSNVEINSNIPNKVYTDYVSHEVNVQNGRNRETNQNYSQLGTLNKIVYPTKGSKNLYYGPNKIFHQKTDLQSGQINYTNVRSRYPGENLPDTTTDIDTTFVIPPSVFVGKENIRVRLSFGNSCNNNNDNISQIHETVCFGSAQHDGKIYGSNGSPKVFTLQYENEFKPNKPIRIFLNRMGDCRCSYSVNILYDEYKTLNAQIPVGGLRVEKVEDIDENNVKNIFNYNYDYFNTSMTSGNLNRPFQYTHLRKKYIKQIIPSTDQPIGYPYLEKYLIISNSGSSYNSYSSSDIVTYKQVTESSDLGKTINFFTHNNVNDTIYTHKYSNYNSWKDGLLEKSIILNKENDTIRINTHEFLFNNLKNPLSEYVVKKPTEIAFANDIEIIKYSVKAHIEDNNYLDAYEVEKKYIPIESAKIENKRSITKEYFDNKILESIIQNDYYNTDINNPINLKKTSEFFPNKTLQETTYSYAHEKSNTKLINANMIGIPLETTLIKKQNATDTGKMISKVETKYDDASHLFPTSMVSYNLQNEASTEVTYDQYDIKGNILQYTTKDSIVTSIIWGYNSTQPIAKITGVPYSVASSLAAEIISASDADISSSTEQTLIDKLDIFRKNSALQNAQITTYTYDPLIGVT
ncbi:hypothetical protein LPB85_20440, partial [Chryseobacterium sp. LC2016-27]|uniref:hypothetical protein n=1 Tax=Chryseobacterium sp. LC2016-27 TaxID=2897326 RepID=UPI001E320BE7